MFSYESFVGASHRLTPNITIRLLEDEGFGAIVAERLQPTDEDLATDENLDRWMRKTVFNTTHASGTCKIGPASDPMSVVDQRLNIHGLENIKVADASVMPNVIRANTNATTIMIGERAADWLRNP